MIKRTISYVNGFTEEQETEDLYFNITKEDIAVNPDLIQEATNLDDILDEVKKQDPEANVDPKHLHTIFDLYKRFIKLAYVKRVGDKPVKNDEVWEEFNGSFAYQAFVDQFFTNPEGAVEFLNECLPADIRKEVAEKQGLPKAPQDHKKKSKK